MEKPTGTADAIKMALPELPGNIKTLLVLNGDDATLYYQKTLEAFIKSHEEGEVAISMMTMLTKRNMEAGRIIRDKNRNFSKILEYKEYQEAGIKSEEINCGVYLIDLDFAKNNLPDIRRSESGENYLTDLLNIAKEKRERINLFILKDHSQWVGINDKKDLKYAEGIIKKRNLMTQAKTQNNKIVHFLGIAGSGTSACAKLAENSGFKVSGCDKNLTGEFTETLGSIKTFNEHNPSHLEGVDILAVTPAVLSLDPNNPEILEAKKRKIKIITWQAFCGEFLTEGKFVIAISGTHGKSTTTAMVGKILEDAGLDPTVLLGATASFWSANFRIPTSSLRAKRGNLSKKEYFVIEADEFNNNFLSLTPDISILTNLEFDHPEYFKDFETYKASFRNFLAKTKHLIIANLSDENSKEILQEKEGITDEKLFPPVTDFSKNLIDFSLKITGQHNILNASAAFNLGLSLEIAPEKIKQSLQNFPGIGRRMEFIGEINGAKIFSDFAHHPTAIKAATEQIKKQFPDKSIWLIYQPHMFSRTKALLHEFVEVFKNLQVDGISVIDIYPSREKDTGLIHAKDLVKAINKPNVKYNQSLEEIFQAMKNNLSEKNVVVFMGAGDIDSEAREHLSS
jgi:UDP-N-acetylmuramate--alanine ligase